MWSDNDLTGTLGIKYPIIQAGMAGGPTTPELVAAVSNAGGLGTLGAGYMAPEAIRRAVRSIRSLTSKPFGVNLFIPENPHEDQMKIEQMTEELNRYRDDLHIQVPESVQFTGQPFEDQLNVLIEEKVPVFSFTFGNPSHHVMSMLKEHNVKVIGTATTVREAKQLEKNDIDIVVGQGSEAGGHRGTFIGSFEDALVGSMALIPQLVDAIDIPVVASGGIMDGRGIVASMALGASGVQMGTAFLACSESGTHPKHKEALHSSTDESTVLTRAFSGKPARGIKNEFIVEMEAGNAEFPDYPIQNALTGDVRKAAKAQNKSEYMSLWAGQASRLSRNLPATELLERLVDESGQVLENLN
jgi:nitronate monooxygenase